MNIIWDTISISIVILHVYPFLRFIETHNATYLWFGLGILVMDLSIRWIKSMLLTSNELFKRPKGATGCDAFCMKGDVSGKPGFPSGHVASSAFFFTYFYLMSKTEHQMTIAIMGTLVTILMAISRLAKKCHNVFQVISGALYGLMFATFWYNVI